MGKLLVSNKNEISTLEVSWCWQIFLDPVGSLVSTLWVGGLVGCHTFSKLVNFECVGVCWSVGVL